MSAFQRIDIAEAERVAAREDAVLMDVREPWDFERGHLNGARNVGQRDIPAIVDDIPKSTPLVIYCYHGNSSQLYAKYLASLGFAEVYSVDGGYEAWQALRLAESAQYLDAASIDTQDEMGMSPLMAAAYIGRSDIVGTLLSQGASADLANNEGNRALWFACASDVPEILDAIIAASADVDHRNKAGYTAIMFAAAAGRMNALKRLIEAGADQSIENSGKTPLDFASSQEARQLLAEAASGR